MKSIGNIINCSITCSRRCTVHCFWKTCLLLCSLLILSVTAGETKEYVCNSIDIRNHVSNFKQLENCTVIEGHLHIVLIDNAQSDYSKYRFPKLVEITDYLMIFRAYGLKSLSHIFPNLSVIRGQKIFVNFALIVFEVPDLEEIGLPGLTTISRGAVRLEKNSNLCYIDTIHWGFITNQVSDKDNFILENKEIDDCVNYCPKSCPALNVMVDHKINEHFLCWDRMNCQKVCPSSCGTNGCYSRPSSQGKVEQPCCDSNCLGGCSGPGPTNCIACRHVFYQGRCQLNCPPGTYEYHQRRCITDEECTAPKFAEDKTKWKLLDSGKCVADCPDGFMQSKENPHKCMQCVGPCPKVCGSLTIDNVASAQKLRGCSVIHGILEIQITGGNQIGIELEDSLGMIEEVTQYIKIVRSYALVSLRFFKNLKYIHGQKLKNDRWALFVLDNHNLKDIWDFKTHPNLTLGRGKVFFHFNRKLCVNKIDTLVESLGLTNQTDTYDVSRLNNGDQVACNMTTLKLNVYMVYAEQAIISWENFHASDYREILSWVINYREAPRRNITIFDARDACGTDVWKTKDVPVIDKSAVNVATSLYELKPDTQYAVYVNTYTIQSADKGATTDIQYFTTKPFQPSPVTNIEVQNRKTNELHLKWEPPSEPNGNVTHYIVHWQAMPLHQEKFEWRDYCVDVLQNTNKSSTFEKEVEAKKAAEKKKNSTLTPGLCECGKDKVNGGKVKDVDKDQERQNQIDFQNAVQDQVYRIQPFGMGGGMYKKRKKRSLSHTRSKRQDRLPAATSPPRTKPPALNPMSPNSIHNTTYNTTHLINKTDWLEMEEETMEIDNYNYAMIHGKTEIVLPFLHHFYEYSIEIIACHDYEAISKEKFCSNRALFSARTLPDTKADSINPDNITIHTRTQTNGTVINLYWPEPSQPNGLIVTYDVQLQLVGEKNLKPHQYCITRKKYKEHNGYVGMYLKPGNWSYRIRATSLAGYGQWTEARYVVVLTEDRPTPIAMIVGFCVATIFIIVLVLLVFGYYMNKKRAVPDQSALYASINPDYLATDSVYVPDEWEVDRDKVELIRELGQGSFGMVYEGMAKGINGKQKLRVAVKTVNENASIKDRIEFLNEASVMKAFDCAHVVKLLGVVSKGQPTFVVMELMANGDLKTFLRMHRPDYEGNDGRKPPTLAKILQMGGEIADGMAYLSAKKYVHRDLAARNCMVSELLVVKIGDFGMTRDIYETDYYRKGGKGLLPVRWMAPESLRDGVFSTQTDVWSYGVVLWEMATLAAQPYQGLSNDQVLKFVVDGKIMEKPEHCPDKLYDMMLRCWKYKSRERLTFNEIIEELVPDLDESFREASFFFSDLNMQNEEATDRGRARHHSDHSDSDGEGDDYEDSVNTPLARSPLHTAEGGAGSEDEGLEGVVCSHHGDADLDLSHSSSLSYDSHLRHSPAGSLHNNQNSLKGCDSSSPSLQFSRVGVDNRLKGSGEPSDTDVIMYNNRTSIKQPAMFSSPPSSKLVNDKRDSDQREQWSPDSAGSPHSNEGSKGSSKSTSSSNGMNGITNGHIPRMIVPNPQC